MCKNDTLYVKVKESDLRAEFPRIKLLLGEFYDNYYMTVCDSGHREVFVFRINQVNL